VDPLGRGARMSWLGRTVDFFLGQSWAPPWGTVAVDAAPRSAPPADPTEAVQLVISDNRKRFRNYPVDGIDPEKLRWIERRADDGDVQLLMELYDDVVKDPHVGCELNKAKVAVAGAPVLVEAGEDSDRAREIAAEGQVFFDGIPHSRQLLMDLLDAEFRGFAAVQPLWEYRGRKLWIKSHQPIESRFFRFVGDLPLVETEANPQGEPLPPTVLWHVCRDKAGPVARGGAGRSVLRAWMYAGYCAVDGMSFLERFGHPHVHVEVPREIRENSTLMERIKNAARSIIVDNYALVPAGVTLKILDTVAKAATVRDVYLAFIEWCESAISKALLGQTLTTQPGKEGSLAQARVHKEVSQEITRLRAWRLAETLRAQLIGQWTAYHYGANAPCPKVRIAVEPPVDEKARAEAERARAETLDVVGNKLKVPIPLSQARREFRIAEPAKGEATVGGTNVQEKAAA
jgi:phage gp29-like protein